MMRLLLALALLFVFSLAEARSPAQRAAFVKHNPCPVTGKVRGPCRGWEVDHVVALCAGGDDLPRNMQWITKEDHKVKTRGDMRTCRALKRQQ